MVENDLLLWSYNFPDHFCFFFWITIAGEIIEFDHEKGTKPIDGLLESFARLDESPLGKG